MNIEEKNVPAAIRAAGSRLFEFHACANDRGTQTPGEDYLPLDEIAGAFGQIGYEGPIVIEAFTRPKSRKPCGRSVFGAPWRKAKTLRRQTVWRICARYSDKAAANQGVNHSRTVGDAQDDDRTSGHRNEFASPGSVHMTIVREFGLQVERTMA